MSPAGPYGLEKPCDVWPGAKTKAGYGLKTVNQQNVYTHVEAYVAAHGPIPEGMIVRHRCDNPPCREPSHLVAGTHKDNAQDAIARGRFKFPPRDKAPKGERNGQSKLSDAEADQIKEELSRDTKRGVVSRLAREYGVSHSLISMIRSGVRRNVA